MIIATSVDAKPKDNAIVSLVETKSNCKSLDKAGLKVDKRIIYLSQAC